MQNQTAKTLKSKALTALEAGKPQSAFKKAQLGLKKFPSDSDFHAIAGFALTQLKQYRKSIPHFIEASKLKPDDPQFAENLANALMQSGQIPVALEYAEQKLEKFPNNKELLRVVDEIQLKGKNWREIIDHTSKKLEKDPQNASLLSARARAYDRIGFVDQSVQDISRAYELEPGNDDIAYQKASTFHQRGEKEESRQILHRIAARNPAHVNTLFQLSMMASAEDAPDMLEAVEKAIASSEQPGAELEFAKAQLTSKIKGLTAALPQYVLANAKQHALNPYDSASEDRAFETATGLFPVNTDIPFSNLNENPLPVFVLGQPRSGTTLMEMMLSSAPHVAGCGELTVGADLSREYLVGSSTFDAKSTEQFAQDYREFMPPLPQESAAFIDKMPHNYKRLGFLLTAFSNAKVINMLRDPRDVGLSKWIRFFPASGMRYASDQKAIAHSANLYRRYMSHWRAVFGDRILTVQYEKLVEDPKTYSQQVAAFCGIDWSEAMMHPEENTKQVRTASIDQVRNKISTKSIGGWQSVSEHIQPMLNGFDPALWPEYDLS